MDNATPDVDNLENETEHLENVNNQIQNLSDEMQLKAYIKELEKQNKEFTDKNADNNDKMQQMTEQLHKNDIEIQALTDDKTRLNDTVAKGKQSYVQLEQKFDLLDEQLTNAYKAKADSKADSEAIANQLQNNIDELQTLRSSEVKALEGQIKELEDKLNQETVERVVIDNSYTAEKDKMVAEFETMKNKLNNISIEKFKQENEMKEEIENLNKIQNQLEKSKNQLEQQLVQNENEIKKLKAKKRNLKTELEERNVQITQFQNEDEIKKLKAKKRYLKTALDEKDFQISQFRNEKFTNEQNHYQQLKLSEEKINYLKERLDLSVKEQCTKCTESSEIIAKLKLDLKTKNNENFENAQVLNQILMRKTTENFPNTDVRMLGATEINMVQEEVKTMRIENNNLTKTLQERDSLIEVQKREISSLRMQCETHSPTTTPSQTMKAHSAHNSRQMASQRTQSYSPDTTRPPMNNQTKCQTKVQTGPKWICSYCEKEFAKEEHKDNHMVFCDLPKFREHSHHDKYNSSCPTSKDDLLCESVPASTRYSAGYSHIPTTPSNSEFAELSSEFSQSMDNANIFTSSSTSESKVHVMLLWKKSVETAQREITYFAANNDSINLKLDNENETFQTNLMLQPGRHKGSLSIEDKDYILEVNEFEVSKPKNTSNAVQVIHLNTIAPFKQDDASYLSL